MSNKQDVVFHSSNLGSGCGQGLRTLGQRSLTDSQRAEIVKLVLKVTQWRPYPSKKKAHRHEDPGGDGAETESFTVPSVRPATLVSEDGIHVGDVQEEISLGLLSPRPARPGHSPHGADKKGPGQGLQGAGLRRALSKPLSYEKIM